MPDSKQSGGLSSMFDNINLSEWLRSIFPPSTPPGSVDITETMEKDPRAGSNSFQKQMEGVLERIKQRDGPVAPRPRPKPSRLEIEGKQPISLLPQDQEAQRESQAKSRTPVEFIFDKLDIKEGPEQQNISGFAEAVRMIESSNNPEAQGPRTEDGQIAHGVYQFKVNPNETKKKGDSFTTALNRLERTYLKKLGREEVPTWIKDAREHKDPKLLTSEQSFQLFVNNLWDRAAGGETDKLLKEIARGDIGSAMVLWDKYHHTKGIKESGPKAINNFTKIFQERLTPMKAKEGGRIASNPNPYEAKVI